MRFSKILVVDNDPDFLMIMQRNLKGLGYANITAEDSPVKAAAFFDRGRDFDLAFIDMTMPEIDGLSLLGMVRQISP